MPQGINFPSDTGDTGRPERQKRDGEGKREGDGNGHKLGRQWRGAAGTLPGDLARGHSDSDGHGHGMGPHLPLSLPPSLSQSHLPRKFPALPCLPAPLCCRSNISIKYSIGAGGGITISQIEQSCAKELGESSKWRKREGRGGGRGGACNWLASISREGREEMRARNSDGRMGAERSGTMG